LNDEPDFAPACTAYAYPCQRFTTTLTDNEAQLGGGVGCSPFTVWSFIHYSLSVSPTHQDSG